MTTPSAVTANAVMASTTPWAWLLAELTPTATQLEYIDGMLLAAAGAFFWQMLQTYSEREACKKAAAAKGDVPKNLPTVDWVSTVLAMGAAPLAAGLVIWAFHWFGSTTGGGLSAGLFLGSGAAAPQVVPAILDRLMKVVTAMMGGPKP